MSPAPPPTFRAGLVDVAPVLVGLVPFALVLGALAAAKGLSPLEVALMSGLVFAGGSQFVAVELWRDPAPVGLLALMALLVNSRHLLMGAALAPKAAWGGRAWPALFFMADEVWALALRRAGGGPVPLPYWCGLAAGLYVNWVALTAAGALLGATVDDPTRYGLDFAFVAVFVALLRGMWAARRTVVAPWVASGLTAALVHALLPGPWYVPAGALAGLAAAVLASSPGEDEVPA